MGWLEAGDLCTRAPWPALAGAAGDTMCDLAGVATPGEALALRVGTSPPLVPMGVKTLAAVDARPAGPAAKTPAPRVAEWRGEVAVPVEADFAGPPAIVTPRGAKGAIIARRASALISAMVRVIGRASACASGALLKSAATGWCAIPTAAGGCLVKTGATFAEAGAAFTELGASEGSLAARK